MDGRCKKPGRAQIREWPAECTCPPLQHQEPLKPKNFQRAKLFSQRPLTLEPLRTLRSETKGQAGACPDRARAIPYTVRAVTIQQPSTATTPGSNKHELSPTPSVSWDSGQPPSTAASSGRRGHARCVPDRPVNAGNSRSLADNPIHRLTC